MVGEKEKATLSYSLSFGGKLIRSFKENDVDIPDVSLWDLDTPNLYDLEATLVFPRRKGERNVTGLASAAFLSLPKASSSTGRKIKLLGLNRHQNYPYVGPAMPASAQKDDADILKEETRLQHRPHLPLFR
jgi:beta-galactosidase